MRTREEINQYKREWYLKNAETLKQRAALWRINNKERCLKNSKNWVAKNKEKSRQIKKNWKIRNAERYKEMEKLRNKKRHKIRMETDPQYKAKIAMRGNLKAKITYWIKSGRFIQKAANTQTLVGCDWNQFVKHIESQWEPGMNWQNHGKASVLVKKWNIDHIIPCASFDLTIPEQQFKCYHYTNLKPMWAIDNIKKSNKYES